LCRTCNAGIGQLGDNIELLEKAIQYLNEKQNTDGSKDPNTI